MACASRIKIVNDIFLHFPKKRFNFVDMKILYTALGSVALTLGIIGIFLPLLPTTPFLLLSAWLYCKSSDRLYGWLMSHPQLGSYIRNYRINKAITLKSKITAVTMLWFTMTICIVFVADSLWLRCMLGVILAGVTWHLLSFRTMAKDENLHIVKVNTPCLIEQAAIVNGTSTDDIISRIAAGSEYYILRNAVMPVGTMSVKLCRDGIMHLEHMNLIPAVHRDSYERQAFMFLEYRCKYMGFHTIRLTVSKNDIQTAASLRGKGFSIIADATENDTYTMSNTFDTRRRRIA